jgi:small subunit ribosomal protein S2
MTKVTLTDLLEAGSHFGHQKRRWNPAMKDFIYGERDGVHVFDLEKTKICLDKAAEFLAGVAKSGGVILFVGTKRQAEAMVKETAIKTGMPYVSVRWMGGLLTNYSELSKRIRKLADYKTKRQAGEFKKYTKKEQLLLDREIAKLEKFFGGVASLTQMPDALFVVDTHREEVAVAEAVRMKIPVVGIVDTNADPNLVDYPIPANDDAVKSIELIVGTIGDAITTANLGEVKVKNKKGEDISDPKVDVQIAEVIEEKLVEEEEGEKNKLAARKAKGVK